MLIHVGASQNSTFPPLRLGTQNSVFLVGHAEVFIFCICTILRVLGRDSQWIKFLVSCAACSYPFTGSQNTIHRRASGLPSNSQNHEEDLQVSVNLSRGLMGELCGRYLCSCDGFETLSWMIMSTVENTAAPYGLFCWEPEFPWPLSN